MSCILRVYGDALDMQALLLQLKLKPYQWWQKGDLKNPNRSNTETFEYSGAKFLVSEASMNQFDLQIEESMCFLEKNKGDILKILGFAGVEEIILDFAIALRNTFTHTDNLPPNFLRIVGTLGISIDLSHYPTSDDEEDEKS